MPLPGHLSERLGRRRLLVLSITGFIVSSALCGMSWNLTMLMAQLSLAVDAWGLIWPGMIAGAGMGLFFVPLTAVAFGSMPSNKLDEASGLSALMRGIGSSIGIAVVSWLFVRQGQVHWQDLLSHINPFNPALLPYQSALGSDNEGSIAELAREITRQAEMQASTTYSGLSAGSPWPSCRFSSW
jgi:DHA2 family multidrug resistance protein